MIRTRAMKPPRLVSILRTARPLVHPQVMWFAWYAHEADELAIIGGLFPPPVEPADLLRSRRVSIAANCINDSWVNRNGLRSFMTILPTVRWRKMNEGVSARRGI